MVQPIQMALEDQEVTAFYTLKGIFWYNMVPFGLKDARATYQRAMQTIFKDMLDSATLMMCWLSLKRDWIIYKIFANSLKDYESVN